MKQQLTGLDAARRGLRPIISGGSDMNRLIRLLGTLMICSAAALIAGCDADPAPPPGATGYVDQGYKPGIAPYMRGTIFERTDLGNIQPYPVSGYSLVAN